MVRSPVPTVMLSSLTWEGTRATFDALRFGAMDVVGKPSRRETESLEAQAEDIVTRVKRAAIIGVSQARFRRKPPINDLAMRGARGAPDTTTRIVVMGCGNGGYYSLLQIVPNLRQDFDDVLIAVIRVAPRFIEPFVAYLGAHSAVPVKQARDVEGLEKGTCYICSCHDAAVLTQDAHGKLKFATRSSGKETRVDSAIDIMFKTVAMFTGRRSVGIIMSGAGSDGAEGLAFLRKSGGMAVVQEPINCMNPSMPNAALLKSPADKILTSHLIADFLMTFHEDSEKDDENGQKKVAAGGSK
jgi:two-component system chemotaxis response regulator CheB